MEAAEKGGYPHFMIKEIKEQPEAIRTTVAPRVRADCLALKNAVLHSKN